MTREDFEKIIAEEFLNAIPLQFQKKIRNVGFLVETEPSLEVRREQGLAATETLLGLYRGIPATARGVEYGMNPILPDSITLYQFPIEEEGRGNLKEIRRIVRETIWHEIAHYFGFDEENVRKRETVVRRKRQSP